MGKRITSHFLSKEELASEMGNAFFIMGWFSREARDEGWSKEEIDKVLTEAKSSDYSNLCKVVKNHCS